MDLGLINVVRRVFSVGAVLNMLGINKWRDLMRKLSGFLLASTVVSFLFLSGLFAQPGGGKGGPGGPGGTPPFVTACNNKSEGASCSFVDERANKTYQGQCKSMQKPGGTETEMVCYNETFMNNMPKPNGQNQPPQHPKNSSSSEQ